VEKRLRLSGIDQALLVAALTDYADKHPDQGPVSSMLMARLTGSPPPDGTVLSHQVPNANSPTSSIAAVPNGDSLTEKLALTTVEVVHADPRQVDVPTSAQTIDQTLEERVDNELVAVIAPVLVAESEPQVPTSSPVPLPVPMLTVPAPSRVPVQRPEPVQVPTPKSHTKEEIVRAWRTERSRRRTWIYEEARVVNATWAGFTKRKERARRLAPLEQQLQLLDSTAEPPPGWVPLTESTP
jgi:hypothetical protein